MPSSEPFPVLSFLHRPWSKTTTTARLPGPAQAAERRDRLPGGGCFPQAQLELPEGESYFPGPMQTNLRNEDCCAPFLISCVR